MSNRIRKTLSVLIAVLMIAVLLPTASLADTSIKVRGVPDQVIGVTIHVHLVGNVEKDVLCSKSSDGTNHWTGSDDGDSYSGSVQYVILQWPGGILLTVPRDQWDIGNEAKGSFDMDLKADWNTTSVSVTKTWVDNDDQDGKRPDNIAIKLTGGGIEKTGTVTGTGNTWTYEFTGLQKYNNGVLITYTADEVTVPEGYSKTVNDLNITNTHIPETTSVLVTKVWNDSNDQDDKRPESINVKVYDGTREVASHAISSPWTYEFTGLPKCRDGSPIVYTVDEDEVTGYAKMVNGYNITNTYTPETTTVSGTKTWNDNNDQDGERPASITVKVYDGTTEVGSKTVTGPNWTYEFTGLPKYRGGSPIDYTVDETGVPEGYAKTVNGYNITNTYTPETTTVSGTKTWNDNNDQDGERPASITVKVYDGTTEVGSKTVTGPNWTYEFTGLPKYRGGSLIDYTVDETGVLEGYAKTVNGYNITNTYTSETTIVSGTKTWNDNNDQDGERPASITVKVYDGTTEVGSKTVTGPNWTYEFTGLPKYRGGSPIDYTVDETEVPEGYAKTVNGYNITNTYTPPSEDTGTLTIRKHVEGEGAPAGDEFDFSIQMVQMLEEYSVMAYAPFSLKDGEGRTYTNLRPGKYLITETHWPDGYEPKSVSKEVTVMAGEDPEVLFTNYYKHSDPPTLTYTVSYHPNGGLGTVPVDMNRYYPGDKAWLKSGAGLYRPNHVFAGWSLIDGTRVNDPYIMGRSDVTFFAIWVPVKVPKTGDQAAPYGLLMMSGAVILAALNLIGKRKHTAK